MSAPTLRRIRVRHNKARAVFALVRHTSSGWVLVRVEPHQGPLPDWQPLRGRAFPSPALLRRALVERMRSTDPRR